MKESIIIALEIYFLAFVIAIIIAFLIKALEGFTKRIAPKKQVTEVMDEGK